MNKARPIVFLAIMLLIGIYGISQQSFMEGTISDQKGSPLQFATVFVLDAEQGTTTDANGFFRVEIPSRTIRVRFSHLGFNPVERDFNVALGQVIKINIFLEYSLTDLPDFEIKEELVISPGVIRLDPKLVSVLPGPSSGIEGLVRYLPGVSATTELSSQYSVRGGNFDENLVYVNGIEIYRPFLVSSGQQEGLSFLNSDLTESIVFSTGGFDAMYGDKLSSVLDIEYRKPEAFGGSFSLSFLEGSLHLDAVSKNNKTSLLLGLRYKSNQYLLGTLATKGEYKPFFSDLQALVRHEFSPKLHLGFLANFNHSKYSFFPTTKTTRFGTVQDIKQFTVVFQGQEVDLFRTAMGAFTLDFFPAENLKLNITGSFFQTDESETFDIGGNYWLQRVETDFSNDEFNQPVGEPLGVGGFLNHARNYLNAQVWNLEHKGVFETPSNRLDWGVKYQAEDIFDRLEEWTRVDSSGYSIPVAPLEQIILQDVLFAQVNLRTNRWSGYIQNTSKLNTPLGRLSLTAGVRFNWWSFNNQILVSPRATLLLKPTQMPRWVFRLSAGFYNQPPFYRELRNLKGELNTEARAQESFQVVVGSEYNFIAWERPFRFSSEAFYKNLYNLIPYNIQDVKIRYMSDETSRGYAYGLDLRLNGEFVPGVDSWASISLMKTAEKFNPSESNPNLPDGYIPRPADQRLNFNVFFQDFLPSNPTFKVQVGFIYATGLPFGPPTNDKFRNALRMDLYRRIDIGFSKQIVGEENRGKRSGLFANLKNMWVSLEIFNVVDFSNTISYSWIKDINNYYNAVPNHLTGRLINLKMVAKF